MGERYLFSTGTPRSWPTAKTLAKVRPDKVGTTIRKRGSLDDVYFVTTNHNSSSLFLGTSLALRQPSTFPNLGRSTVLNRYTT